MKIQKDLIIVLHYTIATIKTKKIQQKKLFSEDIYTFSPVSLIDVSVLPRHFKFSSLYTMGWSAKNRVLPRPLSGYPFFYLCQGNLVYISCFDFSLFSLPVPSYLFWYRCSNATFLLITKLCQIRVVKYNNSRNAKLQKHVYIFF